MFMTKPILILRRRGSTLVSTFNRLVKQKKCCQGDGMHAHKPWQGGTCNFWKISLWGTYVTSCNSQSLPGRHLVISMVASHLTPCPIRVLKTRQLQNKALVLKLLLSQNLNLRHGTLPEWL